MLLERFYDAGLAQASYLIGCAATGEALVVDPNRNVEPYLRAVVDNGLRITHVTETHIHADFVSGSRELAHRTGAVLHLSDEGDADWKYQFPTEEEQAAGIGVRWLHDGDRFMVGNIRFDVQATPGHTPEHLVFLVTDTAGADRPMGALTGDFVFVGDVGRPDLLERAAGHVGTMEAGARTLFRSLQRFKQQPDWLQIWPGHGAGSACGKSLGAVPQSTLGYERLFNWGLATEDEEEFVREVLAGQPEPPRYFAQMKRINKEGPRVLGAIGAPARLAGTKLGALLAEGVPVVDLRPAADHMARHVPGTIGIPFARTFSTWAGWLLPYDRDVALLAPDQATAAAAVHELALIGLDRVRGWLAPDALQAWFAAGRALESTAQLSTSELAERMASGAVARGELAVLDVRNRAEWQAGHLPGVPNIPVGLLRDHVAELPRDRPLAVHCQTGARAAIASSVLRSEGFEHVLNVPGGFVEWQEAGHAVEREETDGAVAGV